MNEQLDTAPCGFLSFTDDGIVTLVNATLLKMLGYLPEDLQGQPIHTLFPLASRLFFQAHLFPLLSTQGNVSEIYLSLKSQAGSDIPVLFNAVRKCRQHQSYYDAVVISIHQRNEYEDEILRLKNEAEVALRQKEQMHADLIAAHKRLEDKKAKLQEAMALLEKLATTDTLTGLKNRRTFEEFLDQEIDLAQRTWMPISLIIVDADHFKNINDTFGHPVGDRYLQQLAEILQANVRKGDLAARYGGEEFVLVLPSTNASGAMVIAEKLRAAVEAAVWQERPLTASLGVATLSETVTDKAQLLKLADQALYISKQNGRNRATHADDLALLMT